MSMQAFLAYIAICMLKANKTEQKEYMSIRGLYFTLVQNTDFKRADLENLRAGVKELRETYNLPISPIKNDYIYNYEIKMQHTTMACEVPTQLIRAVLAGKLTACRCRLLRYAVVLLSTFLPTQYNDLTIKVGQISLSELAHLFKTDTNEIRKLNQQLINMGLISIYNRYFDFNLNVNKRDIYALSVDVDQMEEYAKRKYCDEYLPPREADKQRKLLQMYNAVKNGTEYKPHVMQYLYDYVRKQNISHRVKYYNKDLYWTKRRSEFSKIRSLKPFTRYKYLKQKETDT